MNETTKHLFPLLEFTVLAGDWELFWKHKDTSQTLQTRLEFNPTACTRARTEAWRRVETFQPKWNIAGSGSVWVAAASEEVVMMTALTRRRCTKAWQVGQLPRTHYFSPGTELVMCKVTPVTDWPIVNRETSQVLHEGGERTAQGYAGRENMMYWRETTQRFASLAKPLELREQSLSWPCVAAGRLRFPFRDPAHPLGQPPAESIFSRLRH